MDLIVYPRLKMTGEYTVPGDKSISHRVVIFSALGDGTSTISGLGTGEDVKRTRQAFENMGIEFIFEKDKTLKVYGKGLHGLLAPKGAIDAGNSGTTARLLTGLLSPQAFVSVIIGDSSLSRRPMKRVIEPLVRMGADIESNQGCLPIHIIGKKLKGIEYSQTVSSAQVKTALLLAAMYAAGKTEIFEPVPSRDHTERIMQYLGLPIEAAGQKIVLTSISQIPANQYLIPGDPSSAAFLIAGALILPDSEISVRNVLINESRIGFVRILEKMGARIRFENVRQIQNEPVADISARYSELTATTVEGAIIPTVIDEIPILAVVSAFARGTTIIRHAGELRVKESDRIQAILSNLRAFQVEAEELPDGLIIHGDSGRKISGGVTVDSHQDHRIAMSGAIIALKGAKESKIMGSESIRISWPEFFNLMRFA